MAAASGVEAKGMATAAEEAVEGMAAEMAASVATAVAPGCHNRDKFPQ
jgi:hypothetical protein